MSRFNQNGLKKFLIIIGLVAFIIGLIVHISMPTFISNAWSEGDFPKTIESEKTSIKQINFELEVPLKEYDFYLKGSFSGADVKECSALLLDESEFEKFNIGVPIDSLKPLKDIILEQDIGSNFSTFEVFLKLSEQTDIYLILINQNDNEVYPYYFYSFIHPVYYVGLLVFSIGLIFSLSVLAWYLSGWKRYFIIGVTINSLLFLIRIAMLWTDYSPHNYFEVINPELYNDFQGFYISWAELFTKGILPYSSEYVGCIYTPLFYLTIGTFSFLPIPIWKLAIPLFLYNIGTGYLVYLIVYRLTGNVKRATYSMLFYFLNPFSLMYLSFSWLNPSAFIFFVVLAFYFVVEKKNYLAMLSLGISTMYKQFAVIFFPLLILLIMKQAIGEKKVQKISYFLKCSLIYAFPLILISLPFLIVNFETYTTNVLFAHTRYSIENLTQLNYYWGWPVNFNSFFMLIGTPEIFTTSIAYLLVYFILLGGSFFVIYLKLLKYYVPEDISNENTKSSYLIVETIYLSILLILSFQLFYPRGSYKFYLALLAPFISILFDSKNLSLTCNDEGSKFKFQKHYLTPILISWVIFLCYRYIYFLILIAWIIYLLVIKRRYRINKFDKEKKT